MLAAERDAVGTPEEMRGGAALLPEGEFKTVAGVGHMLPVERPRDLARRLEAWLSSNGS